MKSLLFLTPVIPMVSGNGASMRAGMALEALARNYRVTLVVVSQNSAVAETSIPHEMRSLCARVWVRGITDGATNNVAGRIRSLPSGIRQLAQVLWFSPLDLCWVPSDWKRDLKEWLGNESFEQAHIFRLSMMQVAFGLLPGEVPLILDLDDIESKAMVRLARLQRLELGRLTYFVKRFDAIKTAWAERHAVCRAKRVLICSETDRAELSLRFNGAKLAVMPNGVRMPTMLPFRAIEGALRVLFVGSLDYAPNQDAVALLTGGLAAKITAAVPQGVAWRIVGRRPPLALTGLVERAGMTLVADAPDMREHYEWADAVIVPIRSGGGTRIKILEAISFGKPVVSSTIGAEGLALESGKNILIADTDEQYVSAFCRLASDATLYKNLISFGREAVEALYSLETISGQLLTIHAKAQNCLDER